MSESLWNQFDALEVDGLYLSNKISICDQIHKLTTDMQEKQRTEHETRSLYFIMIFNHQIEYVGNVDKSAISSQIEAFTKENRSSDYHKERYGITQNIMDKWRYAFCFWLLKKDYSFLLKAIEHLIDASKKRLAERNYHDSVTLVTKAFNLSRIYSVITSSADIRNRIIDQALEIVSNVQKSGNARWSIEPSEILALIVNSMDSKKASEIITVLHYDANRFRNNHNYHLFRSLVKASIGICDFLQLEPIEKTQLKSMFQEIIAESHVQEGDFRLPEDGGALVAQVFYRDAITEYRKINAQSQIDELNKKIRSLNSRVLDEMDVIETRIEVPKLQFKAQNEYDLVKEIVQQSREAIPSKARSEQQTRQGLSDNPLPLTARNIVLGDRNPISDNSDDESIIEANITRDLNWKIQIADQYIASAIAELEDTNRISANGYQRFLSDCALLESDALRLVSDGIERHFAKDYVSSIHILVPQIEATLRTLLNSRRINTLKTEGDMIMDNELGGLLRNPEARSLLGVE